MTFFIFCGGKVLLYKYAFMTHYIVTVRLKNNNVPQLSNQNILPSQMNIFALIILN